MLKVHSFFKKLASFSSVEVMLAAAIIGLVVIGIVSSVSFALQGNAVSANRQKATLLAHQSLEAVRNLVRNNFAVADGTYGLSTAGTTWQLSGTSDTVETFTRQIVLSTPSSGIRQVRAEVSWASTPNGSVVLAQQLANWTQIISSISWANARTVSAVALNSNAAGTVAVWGAGASANYGFALANRANTSNLRSVLLSDMNNLQVAGGTNLSDTPVDLVVSGSYIYVVSNSNNQEIQVVNIALPQVPVQLHSINMSGNSDMTAIEISGTQLHLGRKFTTTAEYSIYSIASNPLNPAFVGQLHTSGSPTDVVVSGNTSYILTTSAVGELIVVNISTPASPAEITTYNMTGTCANPKGVMINGNLAVGCANGILHLLNVANPLAITTLDTITLGSSVNHLAASENSKLVFVATNEDNAELKIINVANPSDITILDTIDETGDILGLAYNPTLDRLIGVGEGTNREFVIYAPGT